MILNDPAVTALPTIEIDSRDKHQRVDGSIVQKHTANTHTHTMVVVGLNKTYRFHELSVTAMVVFARAVSSSPTIIAVTTTAIAASSSSIRRRRHDSKQIRNERKKRSAVAVVVVVGVVVSGYFCWLR